MGRKKLGNVMFARRVKPELIPAILKVIGGYGSVSTKAEDQMAVKAKESTFTGQFAKQVELDGQKKLVNDLLNDNERLSREVAEFREKELNWIKMDANEQLNYVVAMLTKCQEGDKSTNPYDQTTND